MRSLGQAAPGSTLWSGAAVRWGRRGGATPRSGAPPEAPRVLLVLPEGVEAVAELPEMRDAVLGVERRAEARAQRIEPRLPLRERGVRGPIPFRHPGKRVRPLHLLEPEVRVHVSIARFTRHRQPLSPVTDRPRLHRLFPRTGARQIRRDRTRRSKPRLEYVP